MKETLLKQCEEHVSMKAEETEQLKLQLEETRQELLLTKNQVCFPALQQTLAVYLFVNLTSILLVSDSAFFIF